MLTINLLPDEFLPKEIFRKKARVALAFCQEIIRHRVTTHIAALGLGAVLTYGLAEPKNSDKGRPLLTLANDLGIADVDSLTDTNLQILLRDRYDAAASELKESMVGKAERVQAAESIRQKLDAIPVPTDEVDLSNYQQAVEEIFLQNNIHPAIFRGYVEASFSGQGSSDEPEFQKIVKAVQDASSQKLRELSQ